MSWYEKLDPLGFLDDKYLHTKSAWDTLATVLTAAGQFGLDTEFYGLDVRKESCVGKARVHVWSVAVATGRRSPLGFTTARGWVLPGEALSFPALRAVLENKSLRKFVHNQPVDDHAIHNEGIDLVGCVNTLNLARWMWPELTTAGGFGLKNLMLVKLHRAPLAEFSDVVNDTRPLFVTKVKNKPITVCSCGVVKCRKRKPIEEHVKSKEVEVTQVTVEKVEKYQHPLESIVPGHKRWELLVDYAAEDAIAAIEVAELAYKQRNPAPFPYGGDRPLFNQEVDDSIVQMERHGFPVDVRWCGEQLVKAKADELAQLVWLRKWHRTNVADAMLDEEIDSIWASPKKLLALFDYFDFPRSPIWKKGRVKQGEAKIDGTALKWIARNDKGAKQIVEHITQLKRIRSGIKYLTKMHNSGGWVHPICGAAGDADDRNGAITGRLGIKGVLEAQQLPQREEVDIYHVRKAIVAADMRKVA